MAGIHYNSDLCSTAMCAECCGCEQYKLGYKNALEYARNLTFRDVTYYDSLNDRQEFRELLDDKRMAMENKE